MSCSYVALLQLSSFMLLLSTVSQACMCLEKHDCFAKDVTATGHELTVRVLVWQMGGYNQDVGQSLNNAANTAKGYVPNQVMNLLLPFGFIAVLAFNAL